MYIFFLIAENIAFIRWHFFIGLGETIKLQSKNKKVSSIAEMIYLPGFYVSSAFRNIFPFFPELFTNLRYIYYLSTCLSIYLSNSLSCYILRLEKSFVSYQLVGLPGRLSQTNSQSLKLKNPSHKNNWELYLYCV